MQFSVTAVTLDQHHPNFPTDKLENYFINIDVPYQIISQDTYTIVKKIVPDGKTMCGLCSRLRRGALYTFAKGAGMNKIALGHHRDDIVETLFLNMFYGGTLKAMPPKLLSDDGENIVIRPLAYCREADIKQYASVRNFPIIPCNLCGSQNNLQRQKIKRMLAQWDQEHPGRTSSIFRSLSHISPSQLLDCDLYDFPGITKSKDYVRWLPERTIDEN